MNWNPVLNKVIEVKREYEKIHKEENRLPSFKNMLEELNNKNFNEMFDCLQINQEGNLILIRYGLAEMQRGMWEDPNSIYRECRSVVIDLEKECLVLTPYRKFFNLDEVEENKLETIKEKISKANKFEVVDKLDGSMQSARWYNGKVFMTGSMSLSQNSSWRLQEGYSMLTDNHVKLLKDHPDKTFIFELISLRDSHVVKYNKNQEGLYLIGIRDVKTGVEEDYTTINTISQRYSVPVTKIENLTLDEVLCKIKTIPANEKEGWILNIDGHRIKVKCDDYIKLHRMLDKISSVNVIIENVAENRVDDMLSKIPDAYKDRVIKILEMILEYKVKTESIVKDCYNKAPKSNKKEFMMWVDKNVPSECRTYVRKKYFGESANVLKKSFGRYKKVLDMGLEEKIKEVYNV